MPATDQNAVYVAVVISILGFMIGFAKGGFGGLPEMNAEHLVFNQPTDGFLDRLK